jgi:hypothetical protein
MTPPPPPKVLPLVPGFERAPARKRPLPDAAAVRLLLVPDSAPPYDDRRSGSDELAEPSDFPERLAPPDSGDRPAPCEPDRRPVPPGPRPRRCGQVATIAWPSQFAQVLAETLAGSRSQGQITPWTSDQARRRIRQLGPMLAAGVAPRVRRVMTSRPAAGVVEMTVIVGCGPKVRALAVRLERQSDAAARWICTAVEAA